MYLEEQITSLKRALCTVSSLEVVRLSVDFHITLQSCTSLDSTLIKLAALKDVDMVLALQRFSKLRRFELNCRFHEPYEIAPAMPENSNSSCIIECGSSSDLNSQVTPSSDVAAHTQSIKESPKLVEDVIERKIRDELKRLNAYGKLDIHFKW